MAVSCDQQFLLIFDPQHFARELTMTNRILLILMLCVFGAAGFGCGSGSQAPPPSAPSPAPATPAPASTGVTPKPFEPSDYRVEWISNQIPQEMQATRGYSLTLTLKNAGRATWQSKGSDSVLWNKVFVAYHWLPAKGDKPVLFEGQRTPLPQDLGPGQTVTVNNVVVTAPGPGSYRLQITLVHEGVVWFEQHGANTLIVPVKVS
jgi:hypothetical protein